MSHSKLISFLNRPVQFLKGIGPTYSLLLKKLKVETYEDLLFLTPFRYEFRQKPDSFINAFPGLNLMTGSISSIEESSFFKSGKKKLQITLCDGTGEIQLLWFKASPYLIKKFKVGKTLLVSGELKKEGMECQMTHPDILEVKDEKTDISIQHYPSVLPIYPLTEGISQNKMSQWIRKLFEEMNGFFSETLPSSVVSKENFLPALEAWKMIHTPTDSISIDLLNSFNSPGHRRIIFEEFFYLQLGLLLQKKRRSMQSSSVSFQIDFELMENFQKTLPFFLTESQQRGIIEILEDIQSGKMICRMLQGDVGSGKTVVAAAVALQLILKKYQVCLMVPTEILADQHFISLQKFLAPFDVRVALLKSDLSSSEKKETLKKIEEGKVDFIVGTQSVIQEKVKFCSLALSIVDEQHRFGVLQRSELKNKGGNSSLLVMTATPIPRTLALSLYGDLEISVLNEKPSERKPIKTYLIREEKRIALYQFIKKEIHSGRQVYVVCPLVEESEKIDLKDTIRMFEKLQKEIFPELKIGLLHGKMKTEEKERVMNNFSLNKIEILVCTTVIEVGVDVPNSTVMVIEHPERFGLSQLHQIRGRVGRGEYSSYCFLMADHKLGPKGYERLKVLCQTNDGFKISEADLQIRGAGDFLGVRQSGLPDFHLASLVRDKEILELARKKADEWIRLFFSDSSLEKEKILGLLKHRWKDRLGLIEIG